MDRLRIRWIGLLLVAAACSRGKSGQKADAHPEEASPGPSVAVVPPLSSSGYDILYLPDADDQAPDPRPPGAQAPAPPGQSSGCPQDMVSVRGDFCIDRYEAVLLDHASGRALSPYYPPSRDLARAAFSLWKKRRPDSETPLGRTLSLLPLPDWQLKSDFEPRAASLPGEVPSGYVSGVLARTACRNAGKRLCRPEEWVTACRGQQGRPFPYGAEYVPGRCNICREAHPAERLHGNASIGHTDPRLNTVEIEGKPLLRRTGETATCRSEWGSDAVFDMVGNVDEWVDDNKGMFLGGFYARGTKLGCDARISAHPPSYYDYSLGVRCCSGGG